MRVLFTSTPTWGHVNPMIPLAGALADRGDEVLWATAGEVRPALEAMGLPTAPAGLGQAEIAREFNRRFPEAFLAGARARLRDTRRAPGSPVVPDDWKLGLFFHSRQLGTVAAPAMLSDLLPLVRRWQPSLLIHEASELAGAIAAAAVGIPSVTHSHGRALPADFGAETVAAVSPLWRRQGLVPQADGDLHLEICPPSLQPADTERLSARQSLRPGSVAAQASEEELPAMLERDESPLIIVTFGTVVDADLSLLRKVVRALSRLDARVLATTGPGKNPSPLGAQPANVHVARFIRQEDVLPSCAAVVSHAGSGTMLGCLAHGVPQLCLPLIRDQFFNAAACEKAGAGLVLRGAASSGEEIKAGAERVLFDPALRSGAARVADEIARMPPPEEVAQILTDRFA